MILSLPYVGILSFHPSTTIVRRCQRRPEVLNISSTFLAGVAEGVSVITRRSGAVETVFLHHGVAVGLGLATVPGIVTYYGGGEEGPVWRFWAWLDCMSVEYQGRVVVVVRVGGEERVVVVQDRVGYIIEDSDWYCQGGLLLPFLDTKPECPTQEMIAVLRDLPEFIPASDEIVYNIIKIITSLASKDVKNNNIDEEWIERQAVARDRKIKEENTGNMNDKHSKTIQNHKVRISSIIW